MPSKFACPMSTRSSWPALPPGDVLAAINAKQAVADIPVPPLPDASRNRAKTGFVTPVGRWMREIAGPAEDVTLSAAVARLGAAYRPGLRVSPRILALVTDGYGARGGIARYNQDLFEALGDGGADILVLPRHGESAGLSLPAGIRQTPPMFGPVPLFAPCNTRRLARTPGRYRLLRPCLHGAAGPPGRPPGARAPVTQAHGTDIWERRRGRVRASVEGADMVSVVSRATRRGLLDWADLTPDRARVLPDTVRDMFVPGEPSAELCARLQLGPGADPAHCEQAGGRRALQGARADLRSPGEAACPVSRLGPCCGRRRR